MTGRSHTDPTNDSNETFDRGAPLGDSEFVAPPGPNVLDRDASGPVWRDPLAWLIGLLVLYVAGFAVWWLVGFHDNDVAVRLTGSAALPGAVVIVLVVLRMRRSPRLDPRTRLGWTIIGLALANYGVAALIHFGAESVPLANLLSPLVPIMEIATYPIGGLGLVLMPKPPRTAYDLVLFWLDVGIVAWSAAVLLWHFLFFPAARAAGADAMATFGAAFFPVADLSMVFALGALALRGVRRSSQAALSAAAVALLFVFAGDTIAGVEILEGRYQQGGMSGFLYSGAWLGMALAAYLQWRVHDTGRPIQGLTDYARSFPWLAYLAVAVAFLAPAIRDWNDLEMLRQHVLATVGVIGLVVARLGITARQNAGLAAAERERLAAAVDQAAEAVLTTDHGLISYVNPAFSRITGLAADEVVGRSPDALRPYLGDERAELSDALVRGGTWQGRFALTRADGSSVQVDMAISPVRDPSGAVAGSVAVVRDTSHEQALEAQLIQAQRMEAIGRLAGGVAHDFNNILTAISGFAELAATEVDPADPVAADIDQIIKSSDRAASLTRSLLAFSRRQVMQPRMLDLNEVLGGLAPMLERIIGEDVRLSVVPSPALGVTLADRAQLEQVVLNLAVNARDAMPGGGRLTIATGNADLDADYALAHVGATVGPHVKLVVSDTGVGMTAEVMEHAFEPFFTTKARGKGTGLGLSTVIGIVAQSGGSVDVESAPGKGSVFTIYLPRLDGTVAPSESADAENPSIGGHETILVAEDEEAVRNFVVRVLRQAGYRVLHASNGQEALTLAEPVPRLDLLFTDMVMPGMSGPELVEKLQAVRPGVRTLLASGYAGEALDLEATGEVPGPYLPKPFTAEALLARVRLALDAARDGTDRESSPKRP